MSWTGISYHHKIIKDHIIIIIILISALAFSTLALLVQTFSEPSQAPGQKYVAAAVENMKNSYGFTFLINEETENYNLKFVGQVVSPNKVIGILSDYDLKVYRISDDTFIKNPVSDQWEMVDEIEMRDLNSFVQNPTAILQQILVNWDEPEEINTGNINETDYTILYYIPQNSLKIKILEVFYPNISQELVSRLSCRLWIDKNNPYLHKMELLMTLVVPGKGNQTISRVITVKPEEGEIDVPLVLREGV